MMGKWKGREAVSNLKTCHLNPGSDKSKSTTFVGVHFLLKLLEVELCTPATPFFRFMLGPV
jgi:hypothetical protein